MNELTPKNQTVQPQKTIALRLKRTLPVAQCRIVRFKVAQETPCSHKTYYRVINGESNNLKVLLVLAKVLKCTMEELLDPNFRFTDPQYEDSISLADQLGAFKEDAA